MSAHGADVATPAGGKTIYYNSSNFYEGSFSAVLAVLLHEIVHTTGFGDAVVGLNLRLVLHFDAAGNATDSYKISDQLQKDCFKGVKNP